MNRFEHSYNLINKVLDKIESFEHKWYFISNIPINEEEQLYFNMMKVKLEHRPHTYPFIPETIGMLLVREKLKN